MAQQTDPARKHIGCSPMVLLSHGARKATVQLKVTMVVV
jgi:hypothetical protein